MTTSEHLAEIARDRDTEKHWGDTICPSQEPADTRTGLRVLLDVYSDPAAFHQDLGNWLFGDLPEAAELRIFLEAYESRLEAAGSESHISVRITKEMLGDLLIKSLQKSGNELREHAK